MVEKSVDGSSFRQIGKVAAKNNGNLNAYVYTDGSVAPGTNFYRIKIEGVDGYVKYSPVMTLTNKALLTLSLYPNPALQNITVTHPKAGVNASIELMNMKGELLQTRAVHTGAVQTELPLTSVSKGAYIIVFINHSEKAVASFTKQ